jgi:TonB family protein
MPERRSERGSAAAEGARPGAAPTRGAARAESGPRQLGRAAAAPPAAFAAVSPAAASSYRGQAIAHLTRFKRYPSGAELRGAEGTPVVSFSLDGGGRVVAVALARSSGHADIDAETVAMVRRAAPFPAPPAGAPQAISAAISFQLR